MNKDTKVGLQLLGIAGVLGLVLFLMSTGKTTPVVPPLARGVAPVWRPATMEEMQDQLVREAREQRELLEQQNELLKDAAFEREFGFRRRLVPLSELR